MSTVATDLLRVGHLNYINAIPLYHHLTRDPGCELIAGVPAELNERLSRNELDVSLVSAYEFLRNRELYDLLPGFCIAAKGEVRSVHLHHRCPIKEIKTIALTKQSASSAQLVKILCKNFWHIDPTFVPLPSPEAATDYDAALIIGDQALLHPAFPGYTCIDLAAAWLEKTQLPMTFALFAVSKQASKERPEEVEAFGKRLDLSLSWAEKNQEQIIELARKQSNLPRHILEGYYPLLRYRLGGEEKAAVNTFATLSGLPHDTAAI